MKTHISRRKFLKASGLGAGAALLAACAPQAGSTPAPAAPAGATPAEAPQPVSVAGATVTY